MTQIVPLQPQVQSDLPVGVEQGARYVLRGPDGTRAVINDPTDVDFVGFLTDLPTGLDSPDVRESSDLIVEGDGGVHGNFYFGRRPWTLTGIIDPTPRFPNELAMTAAEISNRRINKLQRATRALRGDAVLSWSPQGGAPVQIAGRRQQAIRIAGRYPKTFMLAFVSSERRIQSQIVHSTSVAGGVSIPARNEGNTPTPLVVTLFGVWTNPIVSSPTGEQLRLTLTTIAGDTTVLDGFAKTVKRNGSNAYSALQFPASNFFELPPGDNVLTATGNGAGASWRVDWRDSWE